MVDPEVFQGVLKRSVALHSVSVHPRGVAGVFQEISGGLTGVPLGLKDSRDP